MFSLAPLLVAVPLDATRRLDTDNLFISEGPKGPIHACIMLDGTVVSSVFRTVLREVPEGQECEKTVTLEQGCGKDTDCGTDEFCYKWPFYGLWCMKYQNEHERCEEWLDPSIKCTPGLECTPRKHAGTLSRFCKSDR